MVWRLAAVSLSLLTVMLMPSRASAFDPSGPSLCTAQEQRLFSCPIRGKIVSICKMQDGKAAYRFGRPGRIELQSRDLQIAEQGYSGGGEDQVSLQANGYRYIVYARTVRTNFGPSGQHDAQTTSGLVVQKDGHAVMSTKCGGEGDQPIIAKTYDIVPAGPFVPH